jgi:hypothetical protein
VLPDHVGSIGRRSPAYFQSLVDRARRPPIASPGRWRADSLRFVEHRMLAWRVRRQFAGKWPRPELLLWFRVLRPDGKSGWLLALAYPRDARAAGFEPFYLGDLGFRPFRYFDRPPRNAKIYPFWNYRAVADTGYGSVVAGEVPGACLARRDGGAREPRRYVPDRAPPG